MKHTVNRIKATWNIMPLWAKVADALIVTAILVSIAAAIFG